MAVDYFASWSREDLEKAKRQCEEDIAAGKTLIQWGAGDSSGQRRVLLRLQERWEQIYYSLSQRFPEDYPASNSRIRRATARYVVG